MSDSRSNTAEQPSRIKTIAELVQPVSIVIGGCWIAFLYFSYQHRADEANLHQQELSSRQAEILLSTQAQSNKTDLEFKQLNVHQAEILLSTQAQSNKTDLDLKHLNVRQAEIALTTQQSEEALRREQLAQNVELGRQQIELERLKAKQQSHDLAFSSNYRFEREWTANAKRVGDRASDRYRIDTAFRLTNTSTTALRVALMCIDYYSGTPRPDTSNGKTDVTISVVGSPPNRWYSNARSDGDFVWTRIGTNSYILSSAENLVEKDLGLLYLQLTPQRGSGGTGTFLQGESDIFGETYIVKAQPTTHLAFVMNLVIYDPDNKPTYWYDIKNLELPQGDDALAQ